MSRLNLDNNFDLSLDGNGKEMKNRKNEEGHALLVLMMFSTLLFISLGAAIPNTLQMGQREREEELLFRGEQYIQAIKLFFDQSGRYPTTVKELIRTDNIRFLRQAYKDPMTRNGKWRFIHADASGKVVDSLASLRTAKPALKGSKLTSFLSSTQDTGTQMSTSTMTANPKSPRSSSEGQPRQRRNVPNAQFIVGVASRSKQKSIKVRNGETRYNEWEFLLAVKKGI